MYFFYQWDSPGYNSGVRTKSYTQLFTKDNVESNFVATYFREPVCKWTITKREEKKLWPMVVPIDGKVKVIYFEMNERKLRMLKGVLSFNSR